jgi:iron-sulfur cluster assembly protein
MSYTMDVVKSETVEKEDHVETLGDVRCIIDPKSMLFIYGLELDYSDELIGGGFKFSNPNASKSW